MLNPKFKRWIMLIILAAGGGTIYQLPYLRYAYYDSMALSLGLNNTQLGIAMSLYGFVAMICYFPGGWIADRISGRKLLTCSFILTGLGGFFFATMPSYTSTLILHAYWAVTTTLTYWAALIKATRQLGDSSEQGRIFGLLEGGRGLFSTLFGLALLAVFTKLGADTFGLQAVIIGYSGLSILIGIITWFVFEDKNDGEKTGALVSDVVSVIKMPEIWLIALIIFSTYTMYAGQSYITPYITQVFGGSVTLGAFLGLLRTYFLQLAGAPVGGLLADKVRSSTRILVAGFIAILVCLVVFLLLPPKEAFLPIVIVTMIVMAFGVYAVRGIYFATIDEARIPMHLTGAAVGFVSLIGFTPDAFIYIVIGKWLDNNPGALGYRYMFIYMIVVGIIGFIVSLVFLGKLKKKRRMAAASEE